MWGARVQELPAYCAACLGLAGRLGSPAVDAAVQRFLRRSGGGYRWAEPPTLLEGAQEAATVWDVLGPWRQRVPHHTPEGQCDIKYEIVFESGPGGAAAQKLRFGANGHPATGSVMVRTHLHTFRMASRDDASGRPPGERSLVQC